MNNKYELVVIGGGPAENIIGQLEN